MSSYQKKNLHRNQGSLDMGCLYRAKPPELWVGLINLKGFLLSLGAFPTYHYYIQPHLINTLLCPTHTAYVTKEKLTLVDTKTTREV